MSRLLPALLGATVAIALLAGPTHAVSGAPFIEHLITVCPLVLVPLGLRRQQWVALGCAAVACAAIKVPAGQLSAAMTLPYLALTVWVGLQAARDLLHDGVSSGARALVNVGRMELVVGALWWTLSRWGEPVGPFDRTIVTLTAAHFHVAGFAMATVAGALGSRTGHPRAWAWVAGVVGVGPGLVGLGILGSPLLELVSGGTLALGLTGLAGLLVFGRLRGPGAWLLRLSGIGLGVSMPLAVTWAVQEFTGQVWLSIPRMAAWHGGLNVLAVALPALAGVALGWSVPGGRVPAPPRFPRVFPHRPGPEALYEPLATLNPAARDLPSSVLAYFHHTQRVGLSVRPAWRGVALPWARLWARIARRIGNLGLPVAPEWGAVDCRLDDLPHGWVGSTRTVDGAPMYVAAYGRHDELMRVVLPLPLGCVLDSRLRVHAAHGRLELSSRPDGDPRMGVVLWVWGVPVRLPIDERLRGWDQDGIFVAEHDFRVAWIPVLRLDYRITPPGPRALR